MDPDSTLSLMSIYDNIYMANYHSKLKKVAKQTVRERREQDTAHSDTLCLKSSLEKMHKSIWKLRKVIQHISKGFQIDLCIFLSSWILCGNLGGFCPWLLLVGWRLSLSLSLLFTYLLEYTISLAWNVCKYCSTPGNREEKKVIIFLMATN